MKAFFILLGFSALMFNGCKELEDINGSYQVTTVDGQDMIGQGITVNIEMSEEENRISGNNSCNEYMGTFQNPESNKIEVGAIMATKMYCTEKAQIEKTYMTQLALVKKAEVKNDILRLMDDEGNVLIKAKKTNE